MAFLVYLVYLIAAMLAGLAGYIATMIYAGYTMFESRKKEHDNGKREKTLFYVNIAIANLHDVMSKSKKTSVLKASQKAIVKAAKLKKDTKTDGFMRGISTDIIEWLKADLVDKDVEVTGDVAHINGGFAVIGVTLTSVKVESVIGKQISSGNEDNMMYMNAVIDFLSKYVGEDFVRFALVSQMNEVAKREIVDSAGEDIKAYLQKKWSAKVEVVLKSPEDQSSFFYDLLRSSSEDGEVLTFK